MRSFDPDFANHIAGGATTLATCWRLSRRDGATLGFTDHDRVLSFDGTVFSPDSGATGSAMSASADLAVDNAELEGALASDALSREDLIAGRYDGAGIEIWRVNWAAPEQRALLKQGVIGEIAAIGDAFRAEFRGAAYALNQPTGRVYQRLCDVDLGDARCGVNLTDPQYTTSGAVTGLQDSERFIASGFDGVEDGWFALGVLTWTSGANEGARIHIKTQTGAGAIALWRPPGAAIAIGDQFTATAGCDKAFETCKDKFSNAVNFRGFHLMPGNDFVLSYPSAGAAHDGGALK
ncbi:MAG: DUF2163 domain-containing protein [Pseudomonadota bacterium]